MLTDTFTLTVIASTAFVTSIPWLIAYHSQTEWLKEENARLCDDVDDLTDDVAAGDARCDRLATQLAAEKAENENLAGFNETLRIRLAKAIERGDKGLFGKPGLRVVA